MAANGDRVGGGVGEGEIADSVVVEFDQCESPLEMPESSGENCGHMCGIGVNATCVLGCDRDRVERSNARFTGGNQLILHVQNGEDLLGLGVSPRSLIKSMPRISSSKCSQTTKVPRALRFLYEAGKV